MQKNILPAIFCFLAVLCTGCANTGDKDDTAGMSAQQIFQAAKEAEADGTWDKAVKYLERLEARYPYGTYAQQAQLEMCYAHWKDNETEQAIAACDRFLKLHPNHSAVDYVLYLKGLIYFNEDLGYVAYLGSTDPTERDSLAAKESFMAFSELLRRFPESNYADDARQRLRYLLNAMAQNEIHIARYYLKRQAYLAAVNRAQNVLEAYPNTPSNEEALFIMVLSYDALGLKDLKADTQRVLEQNFPQSHFLTQGLDVYKTPWWKLW